MKGVDVNRGEQNAISCQTGLNLSLQKKNKPTPIRSILSPQNVGKWVKTARRATNTEQCRQIAVGEETACHVTYVPRTHVFVRVIKRDALPALPSSVALETSRYPPTASMVNGHPPPREPQRSKENVEQRHDECMYAHAQRFIRPKGCHVRITYMNITYMLGVLRESGSPDAKTEEIQSGG